VVIERYTDKEGSDGLDLMVGNRRHTASACS
jgi:hypothetical protein